MRRKQDTVDLGKLVGKQALLEENGHVVLLFVTANADERLGCLIRLRSQEREIGAAHRVLRPENQSCGTLDRPRLIDERHAEQRSSTVDRHPERGESRVEARLGLEHEGVSSRVANRLCDCGRRPIVEVHGGFGTAGDR